MGQKRGLLVKESGEDTGHGNEVLYELLTLEGNTTYTGHVGGRVTIAIEPWPV